MLLRDSFGKKKKKKLECVLYDNSYCLLILFEKITSHSLNFITLITA